MKDVIQDPDAERKYECFDCGTILVTDDNPVTCPECYGHMRNRGTPIE